MKKFGIIKDELIRLASEAGLFPEDTFKHCSGRAQLLAKIKDNFKPMYSMGIIDIDWLRNYYSEEDLNRQLIYSTGVVELFSDFRTSIIIGDCRCVSSFNATVLAFDKAYIKTMGIGKVYGYGNSNIEASSFARIYAYDRCHVKASNYATVFSFDQANVQASDYVRVFVRGSGKTILKCHSSAYVRNLDAHVEAEGYSNVHHNGADGVHVCEHAVAVDDPHKGVTLGGELAIV